MQLKLSVSSVQGPSLGEGAVAWFRLRGGTIGRARDNDWVLPDPERIVSGHHARILYEQGGYYLEDTSSNGTFLNGQDSPIPPGQLTELQHGDLLAIGDYEVRVEIEEDSAPTASTWTQPPQPPTQAPEFVAKPYAPPTENPPQNAFSQSPALGSDDDPWAAQHYPESTQPPPSEHWSGVQSDHLAPDAINFHPPNASPELIPTDDRSEAPDDILPDDWWKLDDDPSEGASDGHTAALDDQQSIPDPAPVPARATLPEPRVDAGQSLDEQPPGSPANPIHQTQLPPPPMARRQEPLQTRPIPPQTEDPPQPPGHSEPPEALACQTPPETMARQATQVQPGPAARQVMPEPEPVPEQPALGPSSETLANRSTAPTPPLLEAYFEGLGLQAPTLSPEEAERELRQTGRLVRILTDGLMEVLKTRSTLKGEFRLSQTIVQTAENNPLKFCIDAQQALAQLFVDKRPGFMAPEASFGEALTDIKQHQLAVIAGMRAAFDCLIAKFEPETIEVARKASGKRRAGLLSDKQWAYYRDYHADFKANAGDDFQGIFGEDFVRAYEAQIRRLMSGSGEDA
ncbi:MAG: type VI secretion system-associated FHA domain protein TagH [Lamprobacter sp.]|uniref:type VI secretion system-associated FHA domain protein TagH n=1 Tax=Lamprobacter sp. TaxID=3100796 RepID=UPI002B258174|nr:type VI secretion system-associated FHA domain protein TagH [Lamprobacter sp.]MEA3640541.1 type VI secretion system-associated FHA domain protein TagH [Lamprobacter sp.]